MSRPGRPSAGDGRRRPPRCHTERVTHGRAEIHELLLANDLHPSRALGQNFVADANTVRRIARLAGVGRATGWSRSAPAWGR